MVSYLITSGFFIVATLFGLALWSWTIDKKRLDLFSVVVACVSGTAIVAHLIFILSWLAGGLYLILNLTILGVIGAASIYSIFKLRPRISLPKFSLRLCVKGLFFVVPAIYFYVVFSRLLIFTDGDLIAGWITVWGDWAAHMTYTTSFAYGQNFPPQLPIFAGRVFSYPFMADFLSAVLVNLGVELTHTLMLPGFIFTLSAFILLAQLFYSITKKAFTAGLGTLLFFLNGGLGFIYVLFYGTKSDQLTKIPPELIEWMSVLTSQFIPQRGFALGFPLALVVFHNLYNIYTSAKKTRPDRKLFLATGILISILPLIHMHSFLMTLFVAGFVYLYTARHIKQWLVFAAPVVILAIPAVIYFYSGSSLVTEFRFHLGWLAKTPADVPVFLLKNFGLMLILPVIGMFCAPRKIKIAAIPFWLIFVVANLFIFQPWDWDNTKFFVYWYVVAAGLAAIFIEKLLSSRKPLLAVLATLLFVVSIYSGLSDAILLLDIEKNKLRLFSTDQIEVADYIRSSTPAGAVFLNADNHDHLVPVLTGRKTLVGYPGWLWSYGIDYQARNSDIGLIKSGSDQTEKLLKKYRVDYIFIGPAEIGQGFNQEYFDKNTQPVYTKDSYTLYKVK